MQTLKLDPVELTPEIAAAPRSIEAHLYRTAVLATVLERLVDADLPEIDDWYTGGWPAESAGRHPAIEGRMYGDRDLDQVRSGMDAWARALGGTVAEDLVEGRVTITATTEVAGLAFTIAQTLCITGKCETCGGPAIHDQVYQHFADVPCAGAQ